MSKKKKVEVLYFWKIRTEKYPDILIGSMTALTVRERKYANLLHNLESSQNQYKNMFINYTMQLTKTPITGTIQNIRELLDIDILNMYAEELNTNGEKTFHEYSEKFSPLIKPCFDNIKNGYISRTISSYYPDSIIDNIDDMNEIYISAIGALGSDRVFETEHLDGPFFFLPFCVVLRCILAVRGNSSICTEFPAANRSVILNSNEFVAFDYNRDVHYICKNEFVHDNRKRVILKLHYLVTPKFLPRPIARLYKTTNAKYNQLMRYLFLKSQDKDTTLSRVINGGTVIYCYLYSNMETIVTVFGGLLLFSILK
jgi:hypothetical protein